MRRSVKISLGIAVLALVAVAGVLLLTSRSSSDATRTDVPVTASGTTTSSAAQAHEVATALSGLVTDPDSLVATGAREQVGQRAREGVPAGSTVEVNEASWAPDGVGGGVVAATVRSPGLPAVTYAVVMVSEAGTWKVAATIPIADGVSGSTR
jgi:hypothetical protein